MEGQRSEGREEMKPMQTVEHLIPFEETQQLESFFVHPEEVLFFDIETTGFSPKTSSIYLIGCAFYTRSGWQIRQYFADTPAQEGEIVRAFSSFAASFLLLIHFNGQTFDVPFVQAKCKKHALPAFCPKRQLDIYKAVSPYKNLLHLPGCKQKQLEEFVGIHREDPFNGGQLIEFYRAYGESRDDRLFQVLMLHNREDLSGMLGLYPVMAIPLLFEQGAFCVESIQTALSPDAQGQTGMECLIRLQTEHALPASIACHGGDGVLKHCFLSAKDHAVLIRLPVFEGELKYFYPDYKNYSYLPQEDQAIHKSVAVYVDKSCRMPATAATCYTRKAGRFLPCFSPMPENVPILRTSHSDKQGWFALDEAFLSDTALQKSYAEGLLEKLRRAK